MRLALLVTVFTLGGCYFYYPKFPKEPRPQLVDGARVEVLTKSHDYLQSCQPERDRNCHYTGRSWKKESTYRTATIKYDGRPLTQWEARQLVDPEFNNKLERIKGKKAVCSVSLVPSVISVIGLTALTFAGPFYDKLGDKAALVGWGSAALAAGGAIASYPLGGFACRGARRRYNELWHGVDPSATEFIVHARRDGKASGDYFDEMAALAESFNARMKHAPVREAGAEPAVTPAAMPPAKPAEESTQDPQAEAEPSAYSAGDKVLVSWKGTFYKARILSVEPDGKFRIRYDGYDAKWDEVVTTDRMKRR